MSSSRFGTSLPLPLGSYYTPAPAGMRTLHIDWIQDSILERNRRIRTAHSYSTPDHAPPGHLPSWPWLWSKARKVMDIGQTWFVVGIAGVCIGVNAAIISIVSEWLSDIKLGTQFCCWEIEGEEVDGCDSWHPWSNTTFSFVAAHLVRSMAKYAAGSGISEIKCILAGFVMQGFLGFATFFIKASHCGQGGPSVHVACCIGSLVAGMFKKFSRSQGKMREIVTAASAAGVAVAFGSPIGGVLFSIEEMSHGFSIKTMWRSFFCALVATFTLSAMNPFRTGKLVLFQITYDRDWHFFEVMFFVILGIFGGLYGAFVVKFNLQVAAFRRKHLANHGVAEAVTLATLTAMIGYFNRFLRIDMTSSMAILFRECEGGGNAGNLCQTPAQWRISNSLLLATIIRIGLVVISYGCKVPAGIFVPSMAMVLLSAVWWASWSRQWKRRTPILAFLRCVPQMCPALHLAHMLFSIVLLVTKAVGDFLGTSGIADEMIRFNGFPFLEKEDHAYNVSAMLTSKSLSVSAVMRTEIHTLTESGMDEDLLASTDVKGLPIVSSDGLRHIVGYIGRTELRYVLGRLFFSPFIRAVVHDKKKQPPLASSSRAMSDGGLRFWPWVNQTPMTVSPELPLEIVMQLFQTNGVRFIFFPEPRVILVENHGVLTGLVTVKDVLKFIATKPSHEPSWDERGGLDGLLEEVWTWATDIIHRTVSWSRRILRR
ncbi:Cl-channel protein [Lyophyllum atratum]|nr:Cl-channel protein [Lyophyllum atratum]